MTDPQILVATLAAAISTARHARTGVPRAVHVGRLARARLGRLVLHGPSHRRRDLGRAGGAAIVGANRIRSSCSARAMDCFASLAMTGETRFDLSAIGAYAFATRAFSSPSNARSSRNATGYALRPIALHTFATRSRIPSIATGNEAASSRAPFSLMR